MVWSAQTDREQIRVSEITCRGQIGWDEVALTLAGFLSDRRYENCPPVLTLQGSDLSRDRTYIEAHGDPAKTLKGRFVLVGVRLAGLNDQVYSPIHGYPAGVYKHAVALDNLLRYGSAYPTIPPGWRIYLIAAVTYLVMEALREWSRGRPRGSAYRWAGAVVCVAALSFVVYAWRWPVSLVVAVFGYYLGSVAVLKGHDVLSKAAPSGGEGNA